MTPWEESAEVRELLVGTFAPGEGEPAGAVLIYLKTQDPFYRAWSRIDGTPPEGEPDFDPHALLDEVLRARRRATVLYPMSRHAWQGVGEFFWRRYYWRPRRADLREAVTAYLRAAELVIPYASANGDRDFQSAATYAALGLVALSDTATLDVFFAKTKGTEAWVLAREIYVVALGRLDDPRADAMFRELLAEHPQYPWSYIEYLIDRGRYEEALRLIDGRPLRGYPTDHVRRGSLLERLGRFSEAEAEYQKYRADPQPFLGGYIFPLPKRYRVPGSTLQTGMKFRPDSDALPKPQD